MRVLTLSVCAVFLLQPFSVNALGSSDTTLFYDRLASDLKEGKPLVKTVYVALCDNDSQGIIPVRNKSICQGDTPNQNMYWRGKGGLSGWARRNGWKKVHRVTDNQGTILIEQVWKKHLWVGKELRSRGVKKRITAYLIGRAYRGNKIHNAMVDYLHAVNHDDKLTIELDEKTTITYGGQSHIVGYIGHDYFMDAGGKKYEELVAEQRGGDSTLTKGTFALACAGDSFIRPFITRDNVYIFILNNYLAFPGAWTIGGIVTGVSAGGSGKKIHRSAARAFAKGQKCGMGWALKSFSYGP